MKARQTAKQERDCGQVERVNTECAHSYALLYMAIAQP